MNRDKKVDETVATTAPEASSVPTPAGPGRPARSSQDLHEQLLLAMNLTDVIRRHEGSSSSGKKPPGEEEENYIRKWLTTPGVRQGCFTLVFCTALAIPTRRWVLQKSRRQFGTIFPDLVMTPILTLLIAQGTLLAGAQLAQIPITAPSSVADAVCHDTTFIEASSMESSRTSGSRSSSTTSVSNTWDPRKSAVEAMERALQSCRERRDFQQQQQQAASAAENDAIDSQRSSIWSRIKWWK